MSSSLEEFKAEVKALCQKYNVTIAHEDTGGGFEIAPGYTEEKMQWFMSASEKLPESKLTLADILKLKKPVAKDSEEYIRFDNKAVNGGSTFVTNYELLTSDGMWTQISNEDYEKYKDYLPDHENGIIKLSYEQQKRLYDFIKENE